MRNFRFYSVAIAASALLALGGCSRVGGDWKSAQAADTPEAYQDFLHQHPDSEYSVQAQARIKQLSEDKDWQAASAADTPDAYEQFVAQHADSKWAQEARVRIENFQQSKTPPADAGNTPGTGAPPPPAALEPTSAAPKSAKAAAKPKPARKIAASTHTHTPLAQLGAYTSRTRAETAWKHLQEKYPSDLKALKVRYAEAKTSTKTLWRLQVELPTRKAVKSLCASLSHHGQKCIATN